MQAYVLHRLEVAGSQGRQIFAPDTFDLIHRYTGGVPRLINTLCDTSMLASSNLDRDTVSVEDVRAAIKELQWTEYAARTGTRIAPLRDVRGLQDDGHSRDGAQLGAPLARILVATGGHTIGEYELHPGRLIIGRTAANDLQIDSRFVSRHHCQVITSSHSCVIEDLNSTNGIFVQSKRVRHHNLNDGDVVLIGQHELIYVDERAQHHRLPNADHRTTIADDRQAESAKLESNKQPANPQTAAAD